jgi:mRNA interferase MazF
MMDYKRGDIVTVNLNPKKGDEVGKIRPAIILSGDDENAILDTMILMPLSTDLIEEMEPYRMRLKKRGGLKHDSDVLINHIRTLSKNRIGEKIATISEEEYEKIVGYLCQNFAFKK